MNWRRIFAVITGRVSMIAVVLFALMLIRAGALKEKEPKLAIETAGTGLEYVYLPLHSVKHIHRLYFFPNVEKEAETEAKESGNVIVLKKKMYIDGKLREEYEYDSEGNEVKAISYSRNGDIGYELVYEYNESGNVVKVFTYVEGSIAVYEECEYDEDGNCTKHTVYDWDGRIYQRSKFTYDEMGNQIREICFYADGTINYWEEYEYDEMGNKTKDTRYDGSDIMTYWFKYEYNEAGREIKYTKYDRYGIIKDCFESVYDEMGNCIKRSRLERGDEYNLNILGELFIFTTMKVEFVTEYEYEYAYIE